MRSPIDALSQTDVLIKSGFSTLVRIFNDQRILVRVDNRILVSIVPVAISAPKGSVLVRLGPA